MTKVLLRYFKTTHSKYLSHLLLTYNVSFAIVLPIDSSNIVEWGTDPTKIIGD